MDLQGHWQKVYQTKALTEVSWYQKKPETSLQLIAELGLQKDENIIDIGGGDSFLSDFLLEEGYNNISVLDISQNALDRAKERLGSLSKKVTWVCSEINDFTPTKGYKVWHDRATFHFLTSAVEIANYVELVSSFVEPGGYLILGTFSNNGPLKCSGLPISQYSENEMSELFNEPFIKIKSFTIDHHTPFNTIQNFTFGVFKKR